MSTSQPGGRGRTLVAAVFGLLLAAGVAIVVWVATHQVADPPTPGEDAARQTGQAPDEMRPSGGTAYDARPHDDSATGTNSGSGTGSSPGGVGDGPATTGEAPATPTVLPASDPVAVRIPSIDVTSLLHPLGLADDGTLQVPSGDRYDEAAWYDGSPTPGEAGPTVIEGHVTSQGSVPSVFYDLGALTPGDLVEVDREDGRTVTFEVYGTESFPKDAFPKVTVYGNTEGPELRLITCGGIYDPDRGAHVDNIVVFARWVPGS